MKNLADLKKQNIWIRKRILELAYKAGKNGAHVGGSMSVVEILTSVYSVANIVGGENRDRVILSKGHAALALYAMLENEGILTPEETSTFEENGTHFYAHAPRNIAKGIEFSGGSLSLGLSFAAGVAIACKRKGKSNRIFVILGDGECDEGLVWEALMSISNFKLSNITVIVDKNGLQLDGKTSDIMNSDNLTDKFKAFGFDVYEVDGHDNGQLLDALQAPSVYPKAIIANTIKGKGLSFAEGEYTWHHNVITDKLYNQAVEELQTLL